MYDLRMWFLPYLYRYPISIPYAACFVKPFFVAVRCFSHFRREKYRRTVFLRELFPFCGVLYSVFTCSKRLSRFNRLDQNPFFGEIPLVFGHDVRLRAFGTVQILCHERHFKRTVRDRFAGIGE